MFTTCWRRACGCASSTGSAFVWRTYRALCVLFRNLSDSVHKYGSQTCTQRVDGARGKSWHVFCFVFFSRKTVVSRSRRMMRWPPGMSKHVRLLFTTEFPVRVQTDDEQHDVRTPCLLSVYTYCVYYYSTPGE